MNFLGASLEHKAIPAYTLDGNKTASPIYTTPLHLVGIMHVMTDESKGLIIIINHHEEFEFYYLK